MDKKEMLALRLEGRTYKYIAGKAGVSRQYIQEVLSPPKEIRSFIVEKYKGYCNRCGLYVGTSGHVHHQNTNNGENYHDIENLELLCISCHRKQHTLPPKNICLFCGKSTRNRLFCDKECWMRYHSAFLVCSYCEKEFKTNTFRAQHRTESSKSGLIFCSKQCQGNWLRDHFGFGVNPQNRICQISKYTPFRVEIIERLAKGEKLYKIAKSIGYNSGNLKTLHNLIKNECDKLKV